MQYGASQRGVSCPGARVVVEQSPKRTHGGLGSLNLFAEAFGGQLRAILQTAQEKLQTKVSIRSPGFEALVAHSAWERARCQPWHVGQKPFHTPLFHVQNPDYNGVVLTCLNH